MKYKLIMVGLMVILALSLLACQSGSTGDSTEVEFYTCNTFQEQQHVTDEITFTVGKGVTIMLCSNPTTGFQWAEEAQISDPEVVEQVSHEYVAPTGDKVGAAGTEKFSFKALKPGTTTVYLEYGRDWEGGEKAEWTCTLTITVK